MIKHWAAARTVRQTLFTGLLEIPPNYLGISAWYVPWDGSMTDQLEKLPNGAYSINRYATVAGDGINPSHPSVNLQWALCNPNPPPGSEEEPRFTWTEMDRWVDYHAGRGTDLLAQVGGWCPYWAAPADGDPSRRDLEKHVAFDGCPTEPSNMADFAAWLSEVGHRYQGKIKYWLMPNEPAFAYPSEFSGTKEKYAEMCRLASQVLKSIDPANRICGPEISSIIETKVNNILIPFLNASAQGYDAGFGDGTNTDGSPTQGKDWVDIIGVHPYVGGATHRDNPYENIANWPTLNGVLQAAGVGSKEVWASELMMLPPDDDHHENEHAYLIRSAVLAAINGVNRFIWFGLGGSRRPWLQNTNAGEQSRAFWMQMREILFDSRITLVQLMSDMSMRIEREDGKVYYV